MTDGDVVRITTPRRAVRVITIDQETTRNALSEAVVAGLHSAVTAASEDDAIKAIVITGAGDVFCSGGNTKSMGDARPRPLERKEKLWRQNQGLVRAIHATDKPFIAAINGPAVGAGADLALHADIRLIAEEAYLRWSYINLGVVPGAGGAWVLPRMVGTSRALELLWSGRRVEAAEAVELGIATFARSIGLLEAACDVAETFTDKPLQALRLVKRMVQQSLHVPLDAALDAASSHFAVLQETDDHAEAVAAFKENRGPMFRDS